MEAVLTGPLASVFTPSYNKPGYVGQAIASVLAQDYEGALEYWILENSDDGGATREAVAPFLSDPRVIYEEIEFTPEERAGSYPTAVLLNRYYPKANGKYIFYLSDDDLLEPSCVRRCVEFLEADPLRAVCWFSMLITVGGTPTSGIRAAYPVGLGTATPSVDCRVDGGQVAHRKDCLDVLGPPPWFPETPEPGTARHADGVFLDRLAAEFTFWDIPDGLLTHRCTPLSTWDKRR